MAFLHGDPESIPIGKAEKSEAAQKKLAAFRGKIQDAKHVKYWSSPEDLSGKVALSFGQFTRSYPAVGWVHADQQASSETLAEINELRKRIAVMQLALDDARTSPPPGTESLSQGDDIFEILLDYHLEYQGPGAQYRKSLSELIQVESSWDEIFSAIAPVMLDESPEDGLKRQVNEWAKTHFAGKVRVDALSEMGLEETPVRSGFSIMTRASLVTISIQSLSS
jgi:hypothetical protein